LDGADVVAACELALGARGRDVCTMISRSRREAREPADEAVLVALEFDADLRISSARSGSISEDASACALADAEEEETEEEGT
jgi:hypothetical protein